MQSITEGELQKSGLVKAGRDIEVESFRIIDEEIGDHSFPQDEWRIVRRIIHTTGDFDYAQRIRFTTDAVLGGIEALKGGANLCGYSYGAGRACSLEA